MFDLSSKEAFLPQTRDPETGKRRAAKAILPEEWLNSFGLSVEEHAASTQIDLSEGFVSSDFDTVTEEPIPVSADISEV